MGDRRSKKTKNAIKNSLITLLNENAIDKITVTNIVTLADISRSTFYLHYDDVFDLYHAVIDDLIQHLMDEFETTYPSYGSNNFGEFAQSLINFIETQQPLINLLIKSQGVEIIERLKPIIVDKVVSLEHESKEHEQYYVGIVFAVSGIIGIIVDWLENNLDLTAQELSHYIQNIIQKL